MILFGGTGAAAFFVVAVVVLLFDFVDELSFFAPLTIAGTPMAAAAPMTSTPTTASTMYTGLRFFCCGGADAPIPPDCAGGRPTFELGSRRTGGSVPVRGGRTDPGGR